MLHRPERLIPILLVGSLAFAVPSGTPARGQLPAGAHLPFGPPQTPRSAPSEQVVYNFRGGSDGANPQAALVTGTGGSFYGTTLGGGGSPCSNFGVTGCGTVFKLTPSPSGYTETILYRFLGGTDGANPSGGAALVLANDGALYGSTNMGGSGTCSGGCGTVFKLAPTRTGYREKILYSFKGKPDGANPSGGLISDANGALYGMTYNGGTCSYSSGCGTVFKLTPSRTGYTESIAHDFQGAPDGGSPNLAGLIMMVAGR